MENTAIWAKLETTDPEFTKGFNRKGHKGTAINATYGMEKLTGLFGPCGVGWGEEIIESRFDEGALLKDDKTGLESREVIHTIILKLWYEYVLNEQVLQKSVIGIGTTTFVGKDSRGVWTDEEYFKKTMTDAFTNAAKKLGLSADIFMGRYDNQKYLEELKEKFGEFPKRAKVAEELRNANTTKEYMVIYNKFLKQFGPESFSAPSGKQGDKNGETWTDVFTTAWNRIKGIQPFDANKSPETSQEDQDLFEFERGLDNCTDKETFIILDRQYGEHEEWQTDKNTEKYLQLKNEFGD